MPLLISLLNITILVRLVSLSNLILSLYTPIDIYVYTTIFFLLAASVAEQNKREFNTSAQVVVSSRWNPTPEQLRALEDLYRRGTRTPSAEQIQHITAQLRRYGKIEGKNVFYWFQNHKARERQKRRRQMESAPDDHLDMSEKNKELGKPEIMSLLIIISLLGIAFVI